MKTYSSPMRRWIHNGILLLVVALVAMAVTACESQPPDLPQGYEQDPLTVVRVMNDAMNARQIGAALTVFTDDVVFTDSGGETRTGKVPVQSWMQSRASHRSELCDIWMSGNKVTWTVRMDDQGMMRYAKTEAIVQDGKIRSLKWIEQVD